MSKIEIEGIEFAIEGFGKTRKVRNITDSKIHISSIHGLSEAEVVEVVGLASRLEELTDPNKIAEKFSKGVEDTKLLVTALQTAYRELVKEGLCRIGIEFDPNSKLHSFLITVANTSSFQASINLGLTEDSYPQSHSIFEERHGVYGTREVIGVCASPQLARVWTEAGVKAVEQVMQA